MFRSISLQEPSNVKAATQFSQLLQSVRNLILIDKLHKEILRRCMVSKGDSAVGT